MLIVATWGGLMISDHARIRMQQRGIPPLILEWLNEYGHPVFDHHGGKILYFDKVARKRLSHDKGRTAIRRLHEYLDSYAVLSAKNGEVITVGRRYKKIRS